MPIDTNFKFGHVVAAPKGSPRTSRQQTHGVSSPGSSAICRWRSRARTTP